MKKVSYASTVGSLIYAMVCIRPNIVHTVIVVSRFLSNLGNEHWHKVKWILRYLTGTFKICLCFSNSKPILYVYTDAYIASNVNSRKFTSRYIIICIREQCPGNQNCKNVLLCLLLKLNTLPLHKLLKNFYGWRNSYKSWISIKKNLLYIVTVKV